MFLDVSCDNTLLPGCEATLCQRFDAQRAGIEPNKLMRQDDAEGFEIGATIGACSLDQPLELGRARQGSQ
jgi:hypothetical protein